MSRGCNRLIPSARACFGLAQRAADRGRRQSNSRPTKEKRGTGPTPLFSIASAFWHVLLAAAGCAFGLGADAAKPFHVAFRDVALSGDQLQKEFSYLTTYLFG
jgi:hypothetical protein